MMRRASGVVVSALLVASASALVPGTAAAGEPPAVGSAAASAGCGTSTVEPGAEQVFLTSGGEERWYNRRVPIAHDGTTPVPVVFDYHGLSEGAVIHEIHSQFTPKGAAEGFVVVYPQARGTGLSVSWSTGIGSVDVAMFGDVLDEIEADLCIDTNRVFVTGLSQGGFMSSAIACVYADRVAAIAPVAGLRNPTGCDPSRAVPVVNFHGTADSIVSYGPIPGITAAWADRNGCAGDPTTTFVGADDVATVDLIEHPCPVDAPVELYRVTGGGHTWPGSEFSQQIAAVVGYTTFVISATDVIWDFFSRHPLDGVTFTARYSQQRCTTIENVAAALGFTSAEAMLRIGVGALRDVAAGGGATPMSNPPANDGPCAIAVTWSAEDAAALTTAAAAFGLDADQLHNAGGWLVVVLLYLAIVGG